MDANKTSTVKENSSAFPLKTLMFLIILIAVQVMLCIFAISYEPSPACSITDYSLVLAPEEDGCLKADYYFCGYVSKKYSEIDAIEIVMPDMKYEVDDTSLSSNIGNFKKITDNKGYCSLLLNFNDEYASGEEFDFSLQGLLKRKESFKKNNIVDVFNHIWVGGMPDVQDVDNEIRNEYFNSYVETYLMRDAVEVSGVSDTVKFSRFLSACAALVSQQVNYSTLAEASDISEPTAKLWLNVLQGLGIIYLLKPFENNELKRLVKMPKMYFCDTALCAYLSMWLSPETLMNGAASGHYYENYVVMELVKTLAYSPTKANISYYRDTNAKEIDIMIEENEIIHPIEIKKSASPDKREVKKYSVIEKTSLQQGNGGIICMCEEVIPIDNKNCFIPSNII